MFDLCFQFSIRNGNLDMPRKSNKHFGDYGNIIINTNN